MLRLTPLSIQAEGQSSYRVRFTTDGDDAEFSFVVENEDDIPLLKCVDERFWKLTFDDPAADQLRKSLMAFHLSRKQEP